MLITPDFFFGEINIPNSEDTDVAKSISMSIAFHEGEILQRLLGYELYKSFISNPSTQRFQDLVNGVEYSSSGRLKKWRGLIYSNSGTTPVAQIVGYTLKSEEQIETDETVGFNSGENTFTFDGTLGTEDWRGYDITVNRAEYGVMIKDVDYSWNKTTGTFTLLKAGDLFTVGLWLTINFFPSPISVYNPVDNGVFYYSLLAFYIYFFWMKDSAVWNSGVGTSIPDGNLAQKVSPSIKMINAYNTFVRQSRELADFLSSERDTYPEYDNYRCLFRFINDFDI